MEDFNTKQGVLFYDYTLSVEQTEKIDKFLSLLSNSGVSSILRSYEKDNDYGRPEYDSLRLFATILYGFAMKSMTLRDLETSCKYDIRFMYIMEGKSPSHMAFGRFINKVIKQNQEQIFSLITSAIFKHFNLDLSDCFIDGTKIEADANKYKFVWKPTTMHERLSEKVRNLLHKMELGRGVPLKGFVSSSLIAQKISEATSILETKDQENQERKVYKKMIENLTAYLEKSLEYEDKERICGPNRNSYYKTDYDATAMCLKRDYYSGLGSNLHPAYQTQLIMSSGLIASYYLSQDRTDIYTFIPAIEKFHEMYGLRPKRICADSGYGCLENYSYCEKHNIEGYVKYQAWEGECSGRRPSMYELEEDGTITCLGGRKGTITTLEGRHHKLKDSFFYLVENCSGCLFMPYCRRFMKEHEGESKVFEINPNYQKLKQKARDLLLSVKGIEMRVNRSCQSEGGFANIKSNMLYDRCRRIGMAQVKVEVMLTALGYNIRKFLRYCEKGLKVRYWTAPSEMVPEKFKKPSAKRLANRVQKKQLKPVNEQIVYDYHRKHRTRKKEL